MDTRDVMTRLRRERWRVSGYSGEHDEAGATIVDEAGAHVLYTSGGLDRGSPPDDWLMYHAEAQLAASAPELLDALASLVANEPGAVGKAERALRGAAEWRASR